MKTINEILIEIRKGLKKIKNVSEMYFLCWIAKERLTKKEQKIFSEYLIAANDNDIFDDVDSGFGCTPGWDINEYKLRLKWLNKHIRLTKSSLWKTIIKRNFN